MSLSIKSATKIIGSTYPNWFKRLSIEVQVRVEEHSRPIVSYTAVHIAPKLVEPINTAYPHFISNNVADERNKKKIEWYPKKYDLILV